MTTAELFIWTATVFAVGFAAGYYRDIADRAARRAGWPLRLAASFDPWWDALRRVRERGYRNNT